MALLYNLARMTTATTGTGTITLGAAVPGCLTFAQAGVLSGDVVSYGIADGTNSEVGIGTYTAAGTTLTRSPLASTNGGAAINLSGSAQVFIAILAGSLRERLLADRNYFVNGTSGSDSNHGLSSTTAFATWQKAWDTIAALDTQGFNVNVVVADGSYTAGVNIGKWWIGGGKVTFQGNATTPANVLLNPTNANCFNITDAGAGILRLQDFKMQTTTSGDHIFCTAPAKLEYANIEFGAAPSSCHIRAFHPGFKINPTGAYKITGGGLAHWLLYYGVLESAVAMTVTLTGTLNFALAFAYLDNNAKLYFAGPSFDISGATVTGIRQTQELLTEIQTGGKEEATFFPGSIAPTRKPSSVFA